MTETFLYELIHRHFCSHIAIGIRIYCSYYSIIRYSTLYPVKSKPRLQLFTAGGCLRLAASVSKDSACSESSDASLAYHLHQILPVRVPEHWAGEGPHTVGGDPAFRVGYFFEAGDFQALPFLDDFDICTGFRQ